MKDILTIIISVIVSTGIITIFIQHFYDIKIKKHELKLQKYIMLSDELAKLAANVPDYTKLASLLNGALFFSSDNVAKKIFDFNKVFSEIKKEAESKGKNTFRISGKHIKPLMLAIRNELDSNSEFIKDEKLIFFQITKNSIN